MNIEQQSTSATAVKRDNSEDHEYDAYIGRIAERFKLRTENEPLFTTDAYKRHDTSLWDAYLNSFPPDERQFHNCSACRHFIQRYGSLVTIKDGRTFPAVWDEDDAPELYKPAVEAMARLVRRAKVTGVFLSESAELGQAKTRTEVCTWHHFSVRNPRVFKRTTKTAKQAMAERREDRNIWWEVNGVNKPAPPMFAIGSPVWPGLSKLAEEAGETLQVIGKLMGTGGESAHWDGTDLRGRLIEELADLMAACEFVVATNQLDHEDLSVRRQKKLELFCQWHRGGK